MRPIVAVQTRPTNPQSGYGSSASLSSLPQTARSPVQPTRASRHSRDVEAELSSPAMRALDEIAGCHKILETAAAGGSVSDADAAVLEAAATAIPAALRQIVNAQAANSRRSHRSPSPARTSAASYRSYSPTKAENTRSSNGGISSSNGVHHHQSVASVAPTVASAPAHTSIPAALGGGVTDPLREQPLDWFEQRKLSSRSLGVATPSHAPSQPDPSPPQPEPQPQPTVASVDPVRDQCDDWFEARRGRTRQARGSVEAASPSPSPQPSAAPQRSPWKKLQAAVSPEPAPSGMANAVVDAMWDQQESRTASRVAARADTVDSAEAAEQERLRLEKERQASVKTMLVAKAAGAWRRSASPERPPSTQQPTTEVSNKPADVIEVLTKDYGIDKTLLVKPAGEHWKTTIKLKKAREEAARLKEAVAAEARENEQWAGVPAWKRALLEERRRKKEAEEAPRLAAQRAREEEEARFRALPAWKQKILLEKRGQTL